MPEPDVAKSGLLERLRRRRETRKKRAAERALERRRQNLPTSARGQGKQRPGAGGGFKGGN